MRLTCVERLCAHRALQAEHTGRRLGTLERELAGTTACLSAMQSNMERMEEALDATRAELNRTRGQVTQLAASFNPVQELALLRPSSVIATDAERVRRAQLRATSSRSPDPRAATAAMRKVEQMDREAMARYEEAR